MLSIMERCGAKPRKKRPFFLAIFAEQSKGGDFATSSRSYMSMVLQCYERIVRAERGSDWFESNPSAL